MGRDAGQILHKIIFCFWPLAGGRRRLPSSSEGRKALSVSLDYRGVDRRPDSQQWTQIRTDPTGGVWVLVWFKLKADNHIIEKLDTKIAKN